MSIHVLPAIKMGVCSNDVDERHGKDLTGEGGH